MMTEARLDNIVSQIGDNMVEDAKRLALAVVNDAIQEAKDDLDSPIHKITSAKLNKMKNEFAKLFIDVVIQHMGWRKN
jgi:BMFP domain-containing protein YqiC